MSDELTVTDFWTRPESPFHDGEKRVHRRLGIDGRIESFARRLFHDHMPEAHRTFFGTLTYGFLGTVDSSGHPRASLMAGPVGFMTARGPDRMDIAHVPLPGDPAAEGLMPGALVGILGLDMATRVRFRMNGRLRDARPGVVSIATDMSYSSCPQYIQVRSPQVLGDALSGTAPAIGPCDKLDDRAMAIIEKADAFFIATVARADTEGRARGADISHRGGKTGFVRVDDSTTLTAPEFAGNFFFNTVGNLLMEPRAGLLFIDFDTGDVLQLGVTAEIVWDGEEAEAFTAAERLIRYHVTDVMLRPGAFPHRFTAPDFSPILARTGTWQDTARAVAANRQREAWRSYRIEEVVPESAVITSFILTPEDGEGVAPHEPGQYLPVAVPMPDGTEEIRNYSLSRAKNSRSYRISVRRMEGASAVMHDTMRPGSVLRAKGPRGSFTFTGNGSRPLMLISAGVGLTPMIAIADSLLLPNHRTLHHAPIIFLHGARNGRDQAFSGWLAQMAAEHPNFLPHVAYSQPDAADAGRFATEGRITPELLAKVTPKGDCDVYVCGPSGFMQDVYDALRVQGVADDRIFAESFGPSTLRRDTRPVDVDPIEVVFARSGVTATWSPGDGPLLAVARKAGVVAKSSCEVGNCGTCTTRLLAGVVEYQTQPVADIPDGTALICCGRPRPIPASVGAPNRIELDL